MVRFPGPVIDVHCHLGRWKYPVTDEKPADLLRLMRKTAVDRAVVSSAKALCYGLEEGNREVAEEIAGHPELLSYVVVNPNYLELSCREMDRYYRLPNFVGAKIHSPYSGQPTASANTQALLEEVARRGKPVLIHVDEASTARRDFSALRRVATAYPEWAIIKAHGGDGRAAREVADLPNIYFEYAGSGPRSAIIRQALEVLGPERILFGSDATLNDMGGVVGAYYDVNFTPEEREKVLFANARRIFKL